LLMTLLALSGQGGTLPLLPVLVLGGLAGGLSPATYAAVRSLIPRLVAGRQLGRANAAVALSDQLPLLMGAVLVGPSLIFLGPTASLFVAAVMLLIAFAFTFLLPQAARAEQQHQEANTTRSATRWPAHLVALIGLSVTYYLVYGPFETATPPLVREQLQGDEATYSLLWVFFGVGAVAALPLGPLLARWRPGVVNALGAIVWGLVMLPIAFVHDPVVVSALFLLGGVVWGPYTTVETTAVQRWVDPSRHGAIFGLQRSLLASATPLGAGIGALALGYASPAVILGISASACSLAGLCALCSRGLRSSR
jgi:predicted MFS family arabinose efflux permease